MKVNEGFKQFCLCINMCPEDCISQIYKSILEQTSREKLQTICYLKLIDVNIQLIFFLIIIISKFYFLWGFIKSILQHLLLSIEYFTLIASFELFYSPTIFQP